jgi:hypothetical protein
MRFGRVPPFILLSAASRAPTGAWTASDREYSRHGRGRKPDPDLPPAASPVLSIRNRKRAFDGPVSGVLLDSEDDRFIAGRTPRKPETSLAS